MLTTIGFPLFSLLSSFPQEVLARAVTPKSSVTVDPAIHEEKLVVVKFAEGTGFRHADGALAARVPAALAEVKGTLGARKVRRFFSVSDEELDRQRARASARAPLGTAAPADLALYFLVETAGLADSRALVAALNALAEVELAYPKELPAPPPGDIPPVTPSFVSRQGYLAAAPSGFNAAFLRQLAGAWGGGLTVLDIEWGWFFDHEDLAKLRPSSLRGPPLFNNSYNNHGTAVGGELSADPDSFGVTGLTPDIAMLCVTDYPQSGYSVANAIVTGMPFLRPGDVFLLEAQISTPLGLGPTEWVQADFDAIRNATLAGIFTVEAAGNGGVNLDDPRLNRLFDLNFRDSGAIIVGATNGVARTAASFSCYGSRIDANGWGGGVATTSYGDLFNPGGDRRQQYTAGFSGTSSASPMVTSTVVALLAAARAQWSPAKAASLDHLAIRSLLRNHGTTMDPGNTRAIGLRPDLAKLLPAAGLSRGLTILDEARLGASFRIEIAPDFAAGAADHWLLMASPGAANLGIGLDDPCDRLLLDPVSLFTVTAGNFATAPLALSVPVPNEPALELGRVYFQALTWRSSDARICLTSSSMAFLTR